MRRLVFTLSITVMVISSLFAVGYGRNSALGGGGNYAVLWDYIGKVIDSIPKEPLSAKEKEGLIKMREEEKLARDVYLTLYDKWKLPVFYNISTSEDRHTLSIKRLLDKYGIKDPVKVDKRGEFSNPEFKKLYNDLVAKGSKSLVDAITVGALIEELDIYDLEKLMKDVDNRDIKMVYVNLTKGSRNHLRSFIYQLEREGIKTYKGSYLSQKEIDKIISSPRERGVYDENGKVIYEPPATGRGYGKGYNN